MVETKATRLKKLSNIVKVPKFRIYERGDCIDSRSLESDKEYMVRSSSDKEDGNSFTRAGIYSSLGPLPSREVPKAIGRVFKDKDVREVIVQEFVRGVNGVAFCFSSENILVEYSYSFEGVTSGKVRPFVATLPAKISKYENIYKELVKIFEKFGPSDVEFVGINDPVFVQVRPITINFSGDFEFENLKMGLQEMGCEKWIRNDVCSYLEESQEVSKEIVPAYLEALSGVFLEKTGKKIYIKENSIISISGQYFMSSELSRSLKAGLIDIIKLSFRFTKEFHLIKKRLENENSLKRLMQDSILLSFGYTIFKSNEIFRWRERIRKKILKVAAKESREDDFIFNKRLDDEISLDLSKKVWHEISLQNKKGTVVVNGDFESGPFFMIDNPNGDIPKEHIIITDQLYPQLGRKIRDMKGVICENGCLGSHVSILAREYGIPLKIQTEIKKEWKK